MRNGVLADILALVPKNMQAYMNELAAASPGRIKRIDSIEAMIHDSEDNPCAVALIPATGLTLEEWWTLWGFLSNIEPRPNIIVYALECNFDMWFSVLDAGCFDLIVAPFTAEKLRRAINSASDEYLQREMK